MLNLLETKMLSSSFKLTSVGSSNMKHFILSLEMPNKVQCVSQAGSEENYSWEKEQVNSILLHKIRLFFVIFSDLLSKILETVWELNNSTLTSAGESSAEDVSQGEHTPGN